MNQESICNRNQVDVGDNCKNKIPQSFLEPLELRKYIFFNFWKKKFLPQIISYPKVIYI